MRVLLSIKPEFALKIFDGTKRFEYRRAIFKRSKVKIIVVYASEPVGSVIGEFEIGDILHDKPQLLWEMTKDHAGITKTKFFEYFKDKTKGYAIEIKSKRMYEVPMALRCFKIASPPQSFLYL